MDSILFYSSVGTELSGKPLLSISSPEGVRETLAWLERKENYPPLGGPAPMSTSSPTLSGSHSSTLPPTQVPGAPQGQLWPGDTASLGQTVWPGGDRQQTWGGLNCKVVAEKDGAVWRTKQLCDPGRPGRAPGRYPGAQGRAFWGGDIWAEKPWVTKGARYAKTEF